MAALAGVGVELGAPVGLGLGIDAGGGDLGGLLSGGGEGQAHGGDGEAADDKRLHHIHPVQAFGRRKARSSAE